MYHFVREADDILEELHKNLERNSVDQKLR